MARRVTTLARWTGAAALVLALCWFFSDSKAFRDCEHERKSSRPYVALHDGSNAVSQALAKVRLHAACGFTAANENTGAISALSAMVVAFFTGTLWWVTWGMVRIANRQRIEIRRSTNAALISAQAAKRSADAAIALELPMIRVAAPNLCSVAGPIDTRPYASILVVGHELPRYVAIDDLQFDNAGRTTAAVLRVEVGWSVVGTLPAQPVYRKVISNTPGLIVRANSESQTSLDTVLEITDAERFAYSARTATLWLYVSIAYRDFLQGDHVVRRCWYWGCPDGTGHFYFVPASDAPEAYLLST